MEHLQLLQRAPRQRGSLHRTTCESEAEVLEHVDASSQGLSSCRIYLACCVLRVVIQRTPDNLYPQENIVNGPVAWDCSNFDEFSYGGPGAASVFHTTETPSWHPFISQIWNGTCDEGQLTREGLEDAKQHGRVRNIPFITSAYKR